MQGQHFYQPELFSQIDYEDLIPKGHLLRRVDRVLDLGFLPELTKPLYSEDQGRPSIAPDVFVRMVLLQALYNIDSDRQLCEEVSYNLAYRWFCRLSLKDRVPDHSSMTKIRDRLGEKIFERIFEEVVGQCRKAGLVKGETVMVDGSSIKAKASIYNMESGTKNLTTLTRRLPAVPMLVKSTPKMDSATTIFASAISWVRKYPTKRTSVRVTPMPLCRVRALRRSRWPTKPTIRLTLTRGSSLIVMLQPEQSAKCA